MNLLNTIYTVAVLLVLVGCNSGESFKRFASEIFRPEITTTMGSESNATQLEAKISGKGVTQYRYKMGSQASTDCEVGAGYGEAHPISMLISEPVPAVDGPYRLCVYGGNADYWSPSYAYASKFDWIRDTVPPSLADIAFPKPYINTDLNIPIEGADRVNYRYEIVSLISRVEKCPVLGTNQPASEPLVAALKDGKYLLCLSASDLAGNESEVASRVFVKDSVPPKIVLTPLNRGYRTSTKITLKWVFAEEHPSAETLVELSLDNGKTYQLLKAVAPSLTTLDWTTPSVERGGIKIRIKHLDLAGNVGQAESDEIRTDDTPPSVTFYLGSEPTDDACIHPPVTHDQVATHLVPYDYCIKDGGAAPSGISQICVKSDGSSPTDTDSCWTSVADVTKLTLLANGLNTVKLYAKDEAGNTGISLAKNITLNIGMPPTLDIISPSGSDIASKKWLPGETKTLVWKSIDDNTAFTDLKFIVSLREVDDHTKYKYLACNFTNSVLWKQCPLPEIQHSPLIQPGVAANTASFKFVVPSDWNTSKAYLLVVTAIDKSGNAAIASTQELNVGYQVLAGRTYKGLGGSPGTLERSPIDSYIRSDKHGQIFDSTNNLKINAFDYRTCKITKAYGEGATMNDCPDIIELPANIFVSRVSWTYNPSKDVFYAHARGTDVRSGAGILELNFNKRKAQLILGDKAKPVLNEQIPQGALSSDYSGSPELSSNFFYDTFSKKLLFKHEAQLFSIDSDYHIKYIMGVKGGLAVPPDSGAVKQRLISLPTGSWPFVLTKDKRLVIGGPKRPEDPNGGSFGVQYVAEGLSLEDPNHTSQLFTISPTTSRSTNNFYFKSLAYDAINNRIFASLAWNGLYEMALPKLLAASGDYKWTDRVLYSSANGLPERNFLNQNPPPPIGTPYVFNIFSGQIAYGGDGLVYLMNSWTGDLLSFDSKQNRLESVIGFPLGGESDGYGINRRLDTPRYLALDKKGDLLFNDFYNLQKIELSQASTTNPVVKTLAVEFSPLYFRYDPATDQIYQQDRGFLSIFGMNDLNTPIRRIDARGMAVGYDNQFGLSNDLSHPKGVYMNSSYDAKRALVYKGFLGFFDFSSTLATTKGYAQAVLMTNPDLYALNMDYCGGPCAQGAMTSNHYMQSTYRTDAYYGAVVWHSPVSTAAFDVNDKDIYTCVNDKFTKFVADNARVYTFTVPVSGSTALSCKTLNSHFLLYRGKLHFSNGTGVYQLDTSAIESANTAHATLLSTTGPTFNSSGWGSFMLTDQAIIYSDRVSHRLIMNLRN